MSNRLVIHITNFDQFRQLAALLHELDCQTNLDFTVYAEHDGDYALSEDIFDLRNQPFRFNNFYMTRSRDNFGKFGFPIRNLFGLNAGIQKLYEYLMFTSADNQVFPPLVDEIHKAIALSGADVIYWNTIHNQQIREKPPYETLYTQPKIGHIDISSYCIKASLFKQLGGFDENDNCGDGKLMEQAIASGASSYKINQILNVHN